MSTCVHNGIIDQVSSRHIVEHLSNALPDEGLIFGIVDDQGHLYSSDETHFRSVLDEENNLDELICRISDGHDPAGFCVNDHYVIGCQLDTPASQSSYLILLLPGYTYDTAMANMHLIEMVLNQTHLIAGLLLNPDTVCSPV